MRKIIPAWIIILLLMIDAFGAAELSHYTNRVSLAEDEVDSLIESRENQADRINNIKQLLPISEQVKVGGQSTTVDNGWLHTLLATSRNASDSEEREKKLQEASGRLLA